MKNQYMLFGAGREGVFFKDLLGKENVLCFIDSNKSGKVDDLPIFSLNELPEEYLEKGKIIITTRSIRIASEIAMILEKKGVRGYLFKDEVEKKECRDLAIVEYPSSENKDLFWNVNSQNGEDGILEWLFGKIGFKGKLAVEFGAWDGIYLSNIRYISTKNQLKRIYIEGDKKKFEEGKENYKNQEDVLFINEYVGLGKKYKSLDTILKENNVSDELDVLSIDIDGYDYWVWDSLSEYRPRVVVIEYNPTVSNSVVMVPLQEEIPGIGASPKAIVQLAKKKHYKLVEVTHCNLIFIVEEEYDKLGIADNSLETLRSERNYCRSLPIQDYSGRLIHSVF